MEQINIGIKTPAVNKFSPQPGEMVTATEVNIITSKINELVDAANDVAAQIAQKVTAIEGKGLSTEDFTTDDKVALQQLVTDMGDIESLLQGI